MRAAPAVDATLDTGGRERVLIVLLHALAGAVLALWGLAQAEVRASLAALVGVLAGTAALAALGTWLARRALPADAGPLRWNGRLWDWRATGAAVPLARLEVAFDLGAWVLLRLCPAAGTRAQWRVASARGAGTAWHDLRVALAAHAGAAVEADGGRGGARPWQ